jgi:hypothetical protein
MNGLEVDNMAATPVPFADELWEDPISEVLLRAVEAAPRDTTPCPPPSDAVPEVVIPPSTIPPGFDLASEHLDDE